MIQTTSFNENGTVPRIVAMGLQAEVGNDPGDVGSFDLVFAAGRHPVREAADDGTLADALPAFRGVLS